MKLIRLQSILAHLVLVVVALLLAGCGGGGTPPRSTATAVGRATVTFVWPARSRLIPLAANAIVVTTSQNTKYLTAQTLTRPASGNTASVTFNALPVGTISVTAAAYPNADGTGVAQATATTSIVVQANQNTPFSLTMGSVIDHLESSPPNIAIGVGETSSVTVTAKDASGNIVLIKPQTLTWLSSNPAVATVDSTGNVTGVAVGGTTTPVQITVTETESTKSVSIPATVSLVSNVLIAEEHFNYNVGIGLVNANAGTGWNNAWENRGANEVTLRIANDNLSYGNLITSGHCVATDSRNSPFISKVSGNGRPLASSLGATGTVVYFSILLRPTDPIGTSSANSYYGFSINDFFVGKTGAGNYYGMQTGAGVGTGYIGTQVLAQQNTTVFLVVRATFKDGNDQFDLWVNPALGKSLPATPDATKTDLDIGAQVAGAPTFISLDASMLAEFDELRIGTSYAAVAPTQ